MRLLNKISNSVYKDHIISALLIGICTCVLVTLKISENKTFKEFLGYHIGNVEDFGYDEYDEDSFDVFSQDQEYYDSFIGLPASELFDHLESGFWEVLDDQDNHTIYQDVNGSTITIYYNELQIIEVIDISEME